jgi:hypothetical protein
MAKRRAGSQIVNLISDQKSRELTRNTWLQRACDILLTYCWKTLDESYNFASDRISIGGLVAKLLRPKVAGVPTWAISGLPPGSPGRKNHLDVGSAANHKVYYKGEGGCFPQVQAVVSLVCLCWLWLILAPKVLQLCTNHFVWVLCRLVWVSKACQLFLVPSRSFGTPLYPSKCREPGSVLRLFPFSLFLTWTHIWVLQGVGGVSNRAILIDPWTVVLEHWAPPNGSTFVNPLQIGTSTFPINLLFNLYTW